MKVYRGYNKEYGSITYDNWIYVTPYIEQAKWYATRNGSIKNGGIIEYDLDDNIKLLSLDEIKVINDKYNLEYRIDDDTFLYPLEDDNLIKILSKYGNGIKFLDMYSSTHRDYIWVFILFDEKYLKNGREITKKEFDNIQLDEQINEVLRLAGVQINENLNDDYVNAREKLFSLYSDLYKDYPDNEINDLVDEKLDEVYSDLEGLPNQIKVYRAVMVKVKPEDFIKKLGNKLGIYWTDNFNSAIPYNADEVGNEYIFETIITKDMIDYYWTLCTRAWDKEENEIRLLKGSKIKLNNIFFNDKPMDISSIKDKVFEA